MKTRKRIKKLVITAGILALALFAPMLFRVLSNPGATPLPANKPKPQHQKI